jgi:hypothetical protein
MLLPSVKLFVTATLQSLLQSNLYNGAPQDVADLYVLLFVTRNIRGGKGEKMLAYTTFLHMYGEYPVTCKNLLHLFPH